MSKGEMGEENQLNAFEEKYFHKEKIEILTAKLNKFGIQRMKTNAICCLFFMLRGYRKTHVYNNLRLNIEWMLQVNKNIFHVID